MARTIAARTPARQPSQADRPPARDRNALLACRRGPATRSPPKGARHGGVQAAGVFRGAADRQSASRQLPRRDRQFREAAVELRLHLLRGRHARHHGVAGPGRADQGDARGDRRVHRQRHRSQEAHRVQPEPGRRARRARLGVQLRGAPGLAQPHDAVQGEGRQGPRERLGRALRLSEPDGGRHPGLSRDPRAGRRGPEAAPRAVARHRAEVQQRFRRRRSLRTASATRSFRSPSR